MLPGRGSSLARGREPPAVLPQNFWSRLAGRFGTKFYWTENGTDVAIVNTVGGWVASWGRWPMQGALWSTSQSSCSCALLSVTISWPNHLSPLAYTARPSPLPEPPCGPASCSVRVEAICYMSAARPLGAGGRDRQLPARADRAGAVQ